MGQNQAIRQRISLEGGETIRQQLTAIGAAGKKALADFQGAVAGTNFSRINSAIESVKAKAEQLSVAGRKLGSDLGELGSRARGTATNVTLIGGAVGVAATGFALFVKRGGEVVDTLEKIAAELGITTREFENTRDAAEQAGVKEDELTRSLRAIRKAQVDAQKSSQDTAKKQRELTREYISGQKSAEAYLTAKLKLTRETEEESDAFSRLGVEALNADGSIRDLSAVTDDIADAFKGITDGTERSARAFDLLGTRSAKTLNFFGQGADALRKAREEAQRTAPALSSLQKEALSLADDAFDKLRRSVDSSTNAFRATFGPVVASVFNAITEAVVRNRTAFLEYASTIASKVRPIVDDVIALLEGRDKDVKNSFILKTRDAFVEMGGAAQKAVTNIILPALKGLLAGLDTVAKAINGLFGTDLSGKQLAFALVIVKVLGLFGLFVGVVKVAISAIGLFVAAFGAIPLAIAAVGFAIGFVLVRALQAVPWSAFVAAAANVWGAIINGVRAVGDFIASAFNGAAIAVSNAFAICVQFVTDLWNGLLAFFGGLPAIIAGFFVSIGESIKAAFFDAVSAVKTFFDDLWTKVTSIFDRIVSAARRVAQAVRAAVSGGTGEGGGAGASAPGLAGGGQFRGRPGRDTNLAWLTDEEFVMQVSAVKKWGVGFMHAINAGRNPFAGYNAGGLVDSLSSFGLGSFPRFADSGLATAGAGGGTPVYLTLPNGKSVGPMMTGKDVLKLLTQESIRHRISRGAKKPSWIGGGG